MSRSGDFKLPEHLFPHAGRSKEPSGRFGPSGRV